MMKFPTMHLKVTEVSAHAPYKNWPVAQTFPQYRNDKVFSIYAYRCIPKLSLVYLIANQSENTPSSHTLN